MHSISKYSFILLLFLISSYIHAQLPIIASQRDTTKSTVQSDSGKTKTPLRVDYITNPLHSQHFQSIDTSLNGWQLTKPVFAEGLGRTYLSDAYTASQNLYFNENDYIHPVLLSDPFTIYQYNPETLKYLHGTRRFTDLNYMQGHDKDQVVTVNYGQLLSRRLFGGVDYQRAASLGYYDQQIASVSNLDFWLSFYTKNFRYRMFANAIWARDQSQENGGLKTFNSDQQPETLPINLSDAQTRTRSRYFTVTQFWSPSFLAPAPVDTTQGHFNTYAHFLPARLFLTTMHKRNTYAYSDLGLPIDSFYKNTYIDTLSTQDSTISEQFSNKFGIQGTIGHSGDTIHQHNFFEASLNYDHFHIKQGDVLLPYPHADYQFTDLSVSAGIGSENPLTKGMKPPDTGPFWKADANYYFYGRNKNDYAVNGLLGFQFSNALALDVHALADLSSPSLLENDYYSNNFIWNNDFQKKEFKRAGATLSSGIYRMSITADYVLLNNFIYYDYDALPSQIDRQKLISVKLNDELRLRKWHLLTRIIYQRVNGTDILRLPQWQTYNSIYYESHFFHTALFAQAGIDIHYISAYYGDAYMPATRQFYLQNMIRTGDFSNIDAFVNMRIKAARIFLKFENVGSFLNKGIKYDVPGYPITPFAVRFGVSMRFFDL